MNRNTITASDHNTCVENLAAELTEAALPVVLRHGTPGSWLDLELDLWKAIAARVANRPQAYRS